VGVIKFVGLMIFRTRFRSLAAAWFSLALYSCDVGNVLKTSSSNMDATASTQADAQAPDPNCEPSAAADGNGRHNPGSSCISSGCHDTSDLTKKWTLAGTLYSNAGGAKAVGGATVVITDAASKEIKLVTSSNGNFFTEAAITFPVQVKASRCPNTNAMIGSVDASGGNCNIAGCHSANDDRIYVPK